MAVAVTRAPTAQKLDPREELSRIPSPHIGLSLFLRHLPASPAAAPRDRAVLYVHGGTFPSGLSIAHRFDGRSWRDALCDKGLNVWGLDFHDFGRSDPYPEMDAPAEANSPLGRAADCSRQLEMAVRFIAERHAINRVSLIAHSWGIIVAGELAGRCPEFVERMVFFGPICRRAPQGERQRLPGWRLISLDDQWQRFVADVPTGETPVLSRLHFDEWGERYLDTDPQSRTRSPASVKTPSGAFQDIYNAWAGELPYEPGLIRAPVAIVRGEWDGMCTDADASWLFNALSASPQRRDIKVGRATHLTHLEEKPVRALPRSRVLPRRRRRSRLSRSAQENAMNDVTMIHGYDYGTERAAHSPVTHDELRMLEETVGWTEADDEAIAMAGEVLAGQEEAMVDSWRSIIGQHPHLAKWFFGPDGKPDEAYKAAVKKRFVRWVADLCRRERDQAWLDYQEEIGLRHTPARKNLTDRVRTPDLVPLRYLLAFAGPVIIGAKAFLAKKGHSSVDIERMQQAWAKSFLLTLTLWSRPYVRDGLW